MANYNEAYKKLLIVEGGYVNDPDDAGGETYAGISRRFNSNAKFWKVIDEIKSTNPNYKAKDINAILKKNNTVQGEIKNIYKNNYWNTINLDDIRSQKIAESIFDSAVNCGVSATIKLLQRTLMIKETGKFTKDIIDKINRYGHKI